MKAWNKYKIEIALATYWFLNAANTVFVSREVGYFPRRIREQAQMLAYTKPYPWPSILVTWIVFAMATFGIYLILRKTTSKVLWLLIYSVSLLMLTLILIPTDVGGVSIAISEFSAYTFLISLIGLGWGAVSLLKKRLGNASEL